MGNTRPHPLSALIGRRGRRGRGRGGADRARRPPSCAGPESERAPVRGPWILLPQRPRLAWPQPGPTLGPARPGLPAGSRGRPGDDERRINGAQGRQRCLPAALPAGAHGHRAAAARCAVVRAGRGAGALGPLPRRALTLRSAVDGAGAMGVRLGAEGAARGTWKLLAGHGRSAREPPSRAPGVFLVCDPQMLLEPPGACVF